MGWMCGGVGSRVGNGVDVWRSGVDVWRVDVWRSGVDVWRSGMDVRRSGVEEWGGRDSLLLISKSVYVTYFMNRRNTTF